MVQTQVDWSIQDIADRTGLTPRMINIYRSRAEARLGHKLGTKNGRTFRFDPEEVREILKSRDDSDTPHQSQTPKTPNYQQFNNHAEDETLGGLDSLVASGDQNAAMVGRAIGQRWTNIVVTAALQEMQVGMLSIQQQFGELHESFALTASVTPQLPGINPNAPQLEASNG